MKRLALDIELLEDCVFSARSATEGGHESLDRIPGAALLGAAAARLYGELGGTAFTAFHSGRLRFGDGLPLSKAGEVGYPMPRCWHHHKTDVIKEEIDGQECLLAGRITNFLHPESLLNQEENAQPKQLREGYITESGHWLKPKHDLRLKTAIEAATGRAAEGQLFGYDALHRGQRFRAFLEADDAVDAGLFDKVAEALEGEVLLGRSRSAEYGRARIRRVEAEPPVPGEPGSDGSLTLWLLSDLALTDEHGQPTLQPDPRHFGLDGGEIRWDKTFLRPRRYSPWNAARGGYDRERLVLEAGGVITIQLPKSEGYDRTALIERLARGVGRYREAGLGRIWLDPPLLADKQPNFGGVPTAPRPSAPPRPSHPLIAWLEAQDTGWKQQAEEAARSFVDAYCNLINRARRLNGIPEQADFGPSRSQWGEVMHTAKGPAAAKAETLHQALFQGKNAVIKESGEGWSIEVCDDGQYLNLAAWLCERLRPGACGNPDSHRAYAHFLRTAARRIQDDIARRRV